MKNACFARLDSVHQILLLDLDISTFKSRTPHICCVWKYKFGEKSKSPENISTMDYWHTTRLKFQISVFARSPAVPLYTGQWVFKLKYPTTAFSMIHWTIYSWFIHVPSCSCSPCCCLLWSTCCKKCWVKSELKIFSKICTYKHSHTV